MIVINLIFVGLMVFSSAVVVQFMTGRKLSALASLVVKQDPRPLKVTTNECTSKPPQDGLIQASSKSLQKLQNFQEACHSSVTDTSMVFIGIPATEATARLQAKQDSALFKDYAAHGIRPVVIAEPTDYSTGDNIDFADFAAGKTLPALLVYFDELKASGVQGQSLGIWNPFPEANLPYWKNNKVEYFAPSVNLYISTLHKQFPGVQTSIMLNSATYETTDFNWENGDYTSLLPYLKGISPGTINYMGLQGFPWVSAKGGNGLILNASEFLNPQLISEAADYLKVKNVWFNTGTFSTKYALDPERRVDITPEQRKAIFATVLEQVGELQGQGYSVSINIFAQDKSKTPEETNWSYWDNSDPFSSPHTPVLTEFIHDLSDRKANVWLFDK